MKIYLATPYSDPSEEVREMRFHQINKIAAKLINSGFQVFSPISHFHPIAVDGGLPKGFDFWEEQDQTFIEWCDEVWVYQADGWDKSEGVLGEEAIACDTGKLVRYVDPSIFEEGAPEITEDNYIDLLNG